jgi:hypothetical protein
MQSTTRSRKSSAPRRADTVADAPPPSSLESPPHRRWLVAGAILLLAVLAIGLVVALVGRDDPPPTTAEWAETFAVESVVIVDARTTMDEAAQRSKGAASVRCEAILADPAIEAAIEAITDAPDEPTEERATQWATTFREGAEFCVAGDLDQADARFDRADELLLLLGEKADVEVDISGYDRSSTFDDLTGDDFGFTDEQANCILDEVEAAGLEDVVVEDDIDNVDEADVETVTDIFGQCTLGDLFTEEPDDTIDDAVDETG